MCRGCYNRLVTLARILHLSLPGWPASELRISPTKGNIEVKGQYTLSFYQRHLQLKL